VACVRWPASLAMAKQRLQGTLALVHKPHYRGRGEHEAPTDRLLVPAVDRLLAPQAGHCDRG
jgi:hypothetical protein